MKIRTGRRNQRNLYLQLGDEPADNDPCIGFMIDGDDAKLIAEVVDSPWHLNELKLSAEDRGELGEPTTPTSPDRCGPDGHSVPHRGCILR